MITIKQAVKEIIEKSPYLETSLSDGLMNASSLARQLKPYIEKRLFKDIKIGAITMAIKRLETKLNKNQAQIRPYLKNFGDISIKSNLIEFTFINSPALINKQKELLQKIEDEKGIFFTFTQSLYQTTLIINTTFKEKTAEIFKEEKQVSNINGLAAITLTLSEETVKKPGIYYSILKALAWHNINVIEVVSSFTELTIILDNAQIEDAFSILRNLSPE